MSDTTVGTNLELFGTDVEYKIKMASAGHGVEWQMVDPTKPGMYIWRVEKFRLIPVDVAQFGQFYEGDSYVVLRITKSAKSIHFWLGSKTTQDEAGTAAYKTVELDTWLRTNGGAVQYREIQGNESDLFRSYFRTGLTYLVGGVDSGFRHTVAAEHKPILYRVCQNRVSAVPCMIASYNDEDAFVLDTGAKVYIMRGVNYKSRLLAEYEALDIKGSRRGTTLVHVANPDAVAEFMSYLVNHDSTVMKLYRIHVEPDTNDTKLVEVPATKSSLNTDDAFVLVVAGITWIWVGLGSNLSESTKAWECAVKNTSSQDRICLTREGQEPESFFTFLA